MGCFHIQDVMNDFQQPQRTSAMEIFMRNIVFSASVNQVTIEIADVIHKAHYNQGPPLNFNVSLRPGNKGRGLRGHAGIGWLTLPSEETGILFLQDCGGENPRIRVTVGHRQIFFQKSRQPVRQDIVEFIKSRPYVNPILLEERDQMLSEFADVVRIKTVQFGWECRDGVFSPEWDAGSIASSSSLRFDGDRREIRINVEGRGDSRQVVAILFSQIESTTTSDVSGLPVIFFSLRSPPTFEAEMSTPQYIYGRSSSESIRRLRLSSLYDQEHCRLAPYVSLALRLICVYPTDLTLFGHLSHVAHLQKPWKHDYPIEHRELFAASEMKMLDNWLTMLPWPVAYQAEALIRNHTLDPKELLSVRIDIQTLIANKGADYVSAFIRHWGLELDRSWFSPDSQSPLENITQCFFRTVKAFTFGTGARFQRAEDDTRLFDCLHVTVTPTSIHLEGPFPERSNRVIRTYPDYQDCFVRVAFVDENILQYRFDRMVDGPAFVNQRVGGVLHGGLTIAGRKFDFLAYSQSALKEHAVWFVTPFGPGQKIDAPTIIKSLGSFDNLEFDRRLIYCPARYGARLSQAFTATDASVTVEAEEILYLPDIARKGSCFTDGVGTISSQLASDIWKALSSNKRRGRKRDHARPRAFQIRFMGSKGMLSVDYKLTGRALCLRPSMIKFEAPGSLEIEIARAFDKPGRMFLNRPLIMLLEGLGVPAQVFLDLQRLAVHGVKNATRSLNRAGRLLESYGLGTSFRLTSVLLTLEKLGVVLDDPSYDKMLKIAVNHILRELKHHARIPVPGWTLVGVADVHSYLEEGEIFACVYEQDAARKYLEGPIVISRSPTIHPGDVQIVHAIGRPPKDCPFAYEQLQNTVVFSTKGSRSLPSKLGGGDLDGDTYNLTDYRPLHPSTTYEAANYDPAQRRELDRASTISDVADFVVDYINSDVLGIIATNWLIIADQSEQAGIFDADCLKLAKLHSDAVDYPKSGRPVPISEVPKLKFQNRPDWNAPEIARAGILYYESQRAIGKLYRDIELPEIVLPKQPSRSRRGMVQENEDIVHMAQNLSLGQETANFDGLTRQVEARVSEFIYVPSINPARPTQAATDLFSKYSSELQYICGTHTLSHSRSAQLTEEEAVIGTIVAKCTQPRRRKDLMSSLREQTAQLVGNVRSELEGEDDAPYRERLRQAWLAWQLASAEMKQGVFGAKSFWWICLGVVFEIIKSIEEEEQIDD